MKWAPPKMCAEFKPPFPSKVHSRLNMKTIASPGVLVTHIECPYPAPAGGCSFRGFYVLRDSPTGITPTSISRIFFSTVSQSWAKEVFPPASCALTLGVDSGRAGLARQSIIPGGGAKELREPGSIELLNKANSGALRKPLLPIRIQHQRASLGRRLNPRSLSHKCSYG